ncbi:hypothetical protein GCM10027028_29760 [Streptomyces sundarbansensis]
MPRPVAEESRDGTGHGGVAAAWSGAGASEVPGASAGRFDACGQASFPPPAELLSWSESIPPRSPSITTQLSTGLTPYGPPTHH